MRGNPDRVASAAVRHMSRAALREHWKPAMHSSLPGAAASSVHESTGTVHAVRPRPAGPPPQTSPAARSRRASPRRVPASWAAVVSESLSPADHTQHQHCICTDG